MGALTLDGLSGKARIIASGLSIDPVAFGVLGGRYQGSLALTLDHDTMRFSGVSTLSNIDMAAVTAFAGNPDTITGRMSGRIDFAGRGADLASVMRTVRGKARIDIVDGIIKNLGLLNSVVVATSMRAGSLERAASTAGSQSTDEPFSTLGATLMMADGSITTDDLRLESKDLLLSAAGTVRLVASTVDLKGRVQLSDELTQQAGRDLIRYTQDQGRVTLPATITGSIGCTDRAHRCRRHGQAGAAERRRRAEGKSEEGDRRGCEKAIGWVVRAMNRHQGMFHFGTTYSFEGPWSLVATARHEGRKGTKAVYSHTIIVLLRVASGIGHENPKNTPANAMRPGNRRSRLPCEQNETETQTIWR